MNERPPAPAALTVSIAAVERDTGLSKDTLRVWERRYSFPQPARDAFGERIYPLDQVEKLRLLKRLMDQGHRPGKIVGFTIEQLHQLAESVSYAPSRAPEPVDNQEELQRLLDLVKGHQIDEFRRQLAQALLRMGVARFVTDMVAPMNERVGDAWTRGYFQVFEEHLYTESMQVVLRGAIGQIPRVGHASGRPRVLLTTFPQEPHALGLLMAEAMFSLEGAHCISLGVQTPVLDIVEAAEAQQSDIIALSFSAALNPNHVVDGLTELRLKLAPGRALWAGGNCPVLTRRPPRDVLVLRSLAEIASSVADWRAANPR